MLVLYRRHLDVCPQKSKGRQWKRCKCPVWADGTINGFEYRRSLKTTAWEEAERKLKQILESPTGDIERPKLIAEATAAYLKDAAGRHLSKETIRKHKNYLEPFEEFSKSIGKLYLKQITFEDLVNFRASWADSALSAKKKLERFRGFWNFCKRAGWIDNEYAKNLKLPIVKRIPTMPFTQEEMMRIFAGCESKPRLKAFTMVMRFTGMRIIDALQLREDQVFPGKIFLYQQKTGEPVYVPIPPLLNHLLDSLPGRTNETYYFWSGNGAPGTGTGNFRRSYLKLFKRIGIVKGHPHRFRDTFAVEQLLSGTPLEDVSVLLGHTSIKTTEESYSPWVRARLQKLEETVRKSWAGDPVLKLLEGSGQVHDIQ